jgi:hypothetical protein
MPEHVLYTEAYPEGITSITASLARNHDFQQRLRSQYEEQKRREEAAAAEAEKRRREAEEAERRRKRRRRRHKQQPEAESKEELAGTMAMSVTMRSEAESDAEAESELGMTMTQRMPISTQTLRETRGVGTTGLWGELGEGFARTEEPSLTPEQLSFLLPPEPDDVLVRLAAPPKKAGKAQSYL